MRYHSVMTITIDLSPEDVALLTRKASAEGRDVADYIRHLAVRDTGSDTGISLTTPRTPGLNAGRYWIAEDFDAPLPESFWFGAEQSLRR
jgi:hypothetical protein